MPAGGRHDGLLIRRRRAPSAVLHHKTGKTQPYAAQTVHRALHRFSQGIHRRAVRRPQGFVPWIQRMIKRRVWGAVDAPCSSLSSFSSRLLAPRSGNPVACLPYQLSIARATIALIMCALNKQQQTQRHHRHTRNQSIDRQMVFTVFLGRGKQFIQRDKNHDSRYHAKQNAKHRIGEKAQQN